MSWTPDEHLIPSALMGNVALKKLDAYERAWVVVGLFREGLTAEDIAQRCKCSLRLVFQIKAEPIAVAFLYVQEETARTDAVIRHQKGQVDHLRSKLVQAEMDADRYRGQLYGRAAKSRH